MSRRNPDQIDSENPSYPKKPVLRLSSLGLACLFLLLACSTQRVDPPPIFDPVILQLKWKHQFQFAGYYAAVEQGYYRELGLDVQILEAPENVEPAKIVLQGNADFGIAASDLVLFHAKGDPVVALAAIYQHSPLILLSLQGKGVESIHDFAGKRAMIEPHAAEIFAYLELEEVPARKMTLVPHSFDTNALVSGQVDVMSAYSTDEPFLLKQAGVDYQIFNPRAGGIDLYGDTLFTTRAQIREHPQRVNAFLDASLRGWQYAMKNPGEIVDLIYTKYSQRHSREHLLFEAKKTQRLILPDVVEIGYMHPGRWRHITEVYAGIGMILPDLSLKGFLYDGDPKPDLTWLYLSLLGSLSVLAAISVIAIRFYRLSAAFRKEIADRKQLTLLLEAMAMTDELTGLANRRYFTQRSEEEFRHSRRYQTPLSLLMLDADKFKDINDTSGHEAGDRVLRRVSTIFKTCLREVDIAGRLGGDEFGIILPNTTLADAVLLAERLWQTMAQQSIEVRGKHVQFTMSIGAAQISAEMDNIDDLFRKADMALYQEKNSRSDRVVQESRDGIKKKR